MKKYVLEKASLEIKNARDIEPGVTISCCCGDIFDEEIKLFDNKDEALKELSKYKSSIAFIKNTVPYYLVEEYFVREGDFDEDDMITEAGDILELSKMTIEVRDEETDELIGAFERYIDAERAADNYNDIHSDDDEYRFAIIKFN